MKRTVTEITCEYCGGKAMKRKGTRFCGLSCAQRWLHASRPSWAPRGKDHHAYRETLDNYGSLHARIGRERGKAVMCEMRADAGCVSQKYEWAHIHGTDAQNVENYRQLCKSCHITYDGQRGSGHANSRLSAEQVAEIRTRYAAGGVSQQVLANEFGTNQRTVSRIVRRQTYQTA